MRLRARPHVKVVVFAVIVQDTAALRRHRDCSFVARVRARLHGPAPQNRAAVAAPRAPQLELVHDDH